MTKLYEYKTITDDVEIEHELWKEYGDLFKDLVNQGHQEFFEELMRYFVRCKQAKTRHKKAMEELYASLEK